MLLESGASLDGVSQNALCDFAATSTTVIQALLDRGVVVSALRDEDGRTALHCAAGRGSDRAVLSMLVNVCGIDLEACDNHHVTCAFDAAGHGHTDVLRWLVEAGANIGHRKNHGSTPLHFAYERECAIVLLAAGADVHAQDASGRTVAHECLKDDNRPIDSVLPVLHALLAGGFSHCALGSNGRTLLHVAVQRRLPVNDDAIDEARRDIAKERLDFVRHRALQVCIGLQPLDLDALQICEILQFACGPVTPLIRFHQWWGIATNVKHFHKQSQQ